MPDFLSLRLASHAVSIPRFSTPEEAVAHYGCMQAQDIPQATWAIGSRVVGATEVSVRDACARGAIVRTWPMRGTLHYVDPKNVRWLLSLCASKTLSGFAKRREFLWISDSYAEKALETMELALRWGKYLSRSEMTEVLKDAGIPMRTQWTYHLACYAATRGLICFGAPIEKEETFVLLDEWIPKTPELSREEQLSELARTYFRSHSPATVDDLAWWCGLGKTECKTAASLIADELETLEENGKTYYVSKTGAPNVRVLPDKSDEIRLLGGFDEYFLGYKDRSPVADVEHHGKLFTVNGIFFPLVMKGGKIVGSWKRTFKKGKVAILPEILPGFSVGFEELEKEARRYADFYGLPEFEIAKAPRSNGCPKTLLPWFHENLKTRE